MATIIYCSNSGSAKKYAELLSEKTGFSCVDIKKRSTVSADEEIIFVGWIMAGVLQGLKEIREDFANIKAVCGVGMMKSEKAAEETKAKNGITEPYFFLTGDFDINKLTGMYKMMMGMAMKMIKGKLKDSDDPKAREMAEKFEEGFDFVNEENLSKVIEFLA